MNSFALWFVFFVALVRTMGTFAAYANCALYAMQRDNGEQGLLPGDTWFSLGITALAWTIFAFGITHGS